MMITEENCRIKYDCCPLCRSKEIVKRRKGEIQGHPLWRKWMGKTMQWMTCITCDHVFTEGYFTSEAAAEMFCKANAHQEVCADWEKMRPISARIVERVKRRHFGGKWLDIGFGNGSLLFTAQEFGYSVIGVEARSKNVDKMNAMGILAFQDLDDVISPVDVISLCDVLEHVPFPERMVLNVASSMHIGGVVVISMPNLESMAFQLLDGASANPYWGEIEHYHTFSFTRLAKLMSDCGFELMEYGISERYKACMEVLFRHIRPNTGGGKI